MVVLSRGVFTKTLLSLLAAGVSPAPASSPSASPSPDPWDKCEQNPVLPYDHPLELKMRVLDGPDFDLEHYRGHPTLLHIFATWCEPCAIKMPLIVEVANEYASQGLVVIGIDFKESDNAVRAYRKRFDVPFPIAMDEDGSFTNALESRNSTPIKFPTSLYISASGYLYCYTQGTSKHPRPELTYRIKKFIEAASS